MKKYPYLWDFRELSVYIRNAPKRDIGDGEWVPARPLACPSIFNRIRIAWLVFTGKADAFTWPGNQ
jgi:hypothetical protein